MAVPDTYEVARGRTLSVAAPGLLANDVDLDADPLNVVTSPVTGPLFGTVTLAADGSFVYTPLATFVGVDTFTYAVSDGRTATAGLVTIVVNPGVPLPLGG